jgi:hypothetical protein
MTMALIRYRKGGFVSLDTDEEDDEVSNIISFRQYY